MRPSRIVFAAAIAAAACTDTTAPASADSPGNVTGVTTQVSPSVVSLTAPASLYTGYSTLSPHWTHITTMMTDFYYGWTTAERSWAGAHYDAAMSGTGSAWRAVNPTVKHLPYALLWTTIIAPSAPNITTGYNADMKTWFAAHPQYVREHVFLHQVGMPRDSAHRVVVTILGSRRWAINPSDPGTIVYNVDRLRRVTAGETGVFFDETATGNWGNYLKTSQEITTMTAYSGAIGSLVATLHSSLGKLIMLNTSAYLSTADRTDALAAGAVHLELTNDFLYSGMVDRWKWIESLNASGVFVDFVSSHSSPAIATMTSYPAGNSATNVQRAKLWELASYDMAVGASPKLFALQLENTWGTAYSKLWIRAQEANIGHPRAARVLAKSGTDPLGHPYVIYTRDFDRALVVLRLQQGWNAQSYGDASAITYTLPTGTKWIPLNADGTVGSAVTTIKLRQSEAAILLKGNTL